MMHFEYPDDIDEDMIPLMDAMNNLTGISTQFCCSGHSKPLEYDFYIGISKKDARSLAWHMN